MEDRFKFRAWNKMTKTMKEVSQLNFSEEQVGNCPNDSGKCTVHLCWQPSMIIMQCTGLKDNNGNLIFEGDIAINEGTACVIKWDNDKCAFFAETASEYFAFEEDITIDDFEIIGNIYENSELLEVYNVNF